MDKRLVTKTLGNVVLLTFPNGSSTQLSLITFKKTVYIKKTSFPPSFLQMHRERQAEGISIVYSNEIHHLGWEWGWREYIPQLKIHSTLYCQ